MITIEDAIRTLHIKNHSDVGLIGRGNLDDITNYTLEDGSKLSFTNEEIDAEIILSLIHI